MREPIGFVGVGAMGQPMAANLLKQGFPVTTMVHRRPEPARALEAQGARIAPSLAALTKECPVVIACLPTSAEVEAVVLGPGGVLEQTQRGGVFVDMGTSRPSSTQILAARLAARGVAMLDAPITGGVRGAQEGTLTIFVGGAPEVFARLRPALESMGRTILHMGGTAAGHVTKLMNNMLSLASMAILAEVLPLGVRAGLDPAKLIEALGAGSGASAQIPQRGGRILRRNFAPSFRVDLAHKDLRLAQELAQEVNLAVPVTSAALLTFTMARALGCDGEDTTATVKVWERMAGVEVRGTG
ncbi:MAG TPA: NAD(P)-dependent oxidoreductase [bacterium]|nr:NAD(P)-dependent oxidoreductase [bacterium]